MKNIIKETREKVVNTAIIIFTLFLVMYMGQKYHWTGLGMALAGFGLSFSVI